MPVHLALKPVTLAFAALTLSAAQGAAEMDLLSQARLAAVDGRHAECAAKADEARRQPGAVWHAQHVFATCQVFAADARRTEIGEPAYAVEVGKAIGALELLLSTPGLLAMQEQRDSVQYQVQLLRERIATPPVE